MLSYGGLPLCSHLHQQSYAATVITHKFCDNKFDLPLEQYSGHLSYAVRFFFPQGWPHMKGNTLYTVFIFLNGHHLYPFYEKNVAHSPGQSHFIGRY